MASLSRYEQSSPVEIDVVDERHPVGSDLIFLEQLLQVDLFDYFVGIDIPMEQFGIEPTGHTQIALLGCDEFHCVDDIVMSVAQLGSAIELSIVEMDVALIISSRD